VKLPAYTRLPQRNGRQEVCEVPFTGRRYLFIAQPQNVQLLTSPRPLQNRQQSRFDIMAAGQYDQSEKLLYVRSPWPRLAALNLRKAHSEYLKRDDQYLAWRTLQEENTNRMVREARDHDRALAQGNGVAMADPNAGLDEDVPMEEVNGVTGLPEPHGSKIVVIHPGSQNLRIGLANDALPKTVPMCIARKARQNESEKDGAEPRPKRIKTEPDPPEKWFGDEFAAQYNQMSSELKIRMRNNKRRLLPNSKELVVNYNRRTEPETISEHNDPHRIDWTEIPLDPKRAPEYITGQDALRIPELSRPRYKVVWPMRHGWLNEKEYTQRNLMLNDVYTILDEAIKSQLGLTQKKELQQYSCVFIIPDLYERNYVVTMLDMLIREFGFKRVCFMQESLAASFGAGYSMACIVDVGAQKTSICCVEDGMCIEESRMNLKYGGWDVTELFIKMMLFDYFPYKEINLLRRYDFLVAEELKQKFCSMNESDVTVQLWDFHLRASGQDTRKYTFKTYDETMLSPMVCQPSSCCASAPDSRKTGLFPTANLRLHRQTRGPPQPPRPLVRPLRWLSQRPVLQRPVRRAAIRRRAHRQRSGGGARRAARRPRLSRAHRPRQADAPAGAAGGAGRDAEVVGGRIASARKRDAGAGRPQRVAGGGRRRRRQEGQRRGGPRGRARARRRAARPRRARHAARRGDPGGGARRRARRRPQDARLLRRHYGRGRRREDRRVQCVPRGQAARAIAWVHQGDPDWAAAARPRSAAGGVEGRERLCAPE